MGLWLGLVLGCRPDPTPPADPPPVTTPTLRIPRPTWAVASRVGRSPLAAPATDEEIAARLLLADVVQRHALVPGNPWALTHAMLALGGDVVLPDGRPAVDALFGDYGESLPLDDGTGVRFPTTKAETRVEPHADLVLKQITELGLRPERAVLAAGEAHTLGDLYRGSLARAWVDGEQTGFADWDDVAWSLQGLAAWAPDDLAWVADGGHAMTMDTFTSATVARLRQETAFLREARAAGGTFEKRGQGIFAHTCGGAHLFQGASYAVARGFGADADRAAIAEEFDVLLWRARIEIAQVDALIATRPEYGVVLAEQRLKFFGHFLESTHKALALGLVEPTEGRAAELAWARTEWLRSVQLIERAGVWGRLDEVRATNEQVYLDYVGDAAHAMRGFDLATGVGTITY